MPARPLAPYPRYFPPGTRKYYWVTSIANQAAPTRAELNAGTDITGQVASVTGFVLQVNVSDVTPLGSSTVLWLNTTTDPSSFGTNEIILYASQNSIDDARLVMPAGSAGFLVFLFEGDITGQLCEVWPANVNEMYFEQATDTPGEIHFEFTITGAPSQNVTIP